MFVYKLLARILKQNDEIIETFYHSLQPYPVREINNNRYLVFSQLIEIIILQTLALGIRHPLHPLSR
jgi:hypothetical protein